MAYPPAPGHLQGSASVSFNLVSVDSRPLIPLKLDIIPILPGRSLGCVCLSLCARLEVPQESPFFSLGLEQGLLTFCLNELELTLNPPKKID